jgi:hypothetical protein
VQEPNHFPDLLSAAAGQAHFSLPGLKNDRTVAESGNQKKVKKQAFDGLATANRMACWFRVFDFRGFAIFGIDLPSYFFFFVQLGSKFEIRFNKNSYEQP